MIALTATTIIMILVKIKIATIGTLIASALIVFIIVMLLVILHVLTQRRYSEPCMLVILHTCNIRQTNANKLKTSKVLFIFMHVLTAKGYGTLFSHIFFFLFTPSSFSKALSILPLAFEKWRDMKKVVFFFAYLWKSYSQLSIEDNTTSVQCLRIKHKLFHCRINIILALL